MKDPKSGSVSYSAVVCRASLFLDEEFFTPIVKARKGRRVAQMRVEPMLSIACSVDAMLKYALFWQIFGKPPRHRNLLLHAPGVRGARSR